jgi:hypothetical protein
LNVGGGWQCSVRFIRGRAAEIVEAVGDHADLDPGTVDAQSALIQGLLHLRRGGALRADTTAGDGTVRFLRRASQVRQRSVCTDVGNSRLIDRTSEGSDASTGQ